MCTEEDIKHMREWIKKVGWMKLELEDHEVRLFVNNSKGSLQKAKQRCERFYLFRHKLVSYVDFDLNAPNIQATLQHVYICLLPKKLNNELVVIVRKKCETSTTPTLVHDCLLILVYLVFGGMWDERLENCRTNIIWDYYGYGLAETKGFTPDSFKLMSDLISGSLPYKFRAYDLMPPSSVKWILKAVEALAPAKIGKVKTMCTSLDELYKFFPKEILPKEYGGKEASLQELCDDLMAEFKQFKFDERLLQEKEKILSERDSLPKEYVAELTETFRKLEID